MYWQHILFLGKKHKLPKVFSRQRRITIGTAVDQLMQCLLY